MLFRFILTKFEYFYREKPLHLNTVVQTLASTITNYRWSNARGSIVQGKHITIPRMHVYVLHYKCNCIQHFKLHKNWNWTININLMFN